MIAADRYAAATRGEDLGLGADEPTTRRFTRPTDQIAPVTGRHRADDQEREDEPDDELDWRGSDTNNNTGHGSLHQDRPVAGVHNPHPQQEEQAMPNPTPYERGYESAQRELDQLAGYSDVDRIADAASKLLDSLPVTIDSEADPVRCEFDSGYQRALLDAVDEANVIRCAHCGSDQYAVEDLDIAAGVCCTTAPTVELLHDVLGAVVPNNIGELVDLADMVCDAEHGCLDVATAVV